MAVQNRSKLVRFWPVLHSQIWRTVTGSPVFLQFSSVQFAVILQFIELDLESLFRTLRRRTRRRRAQPCFFPPSGKSFHSAPPINVPSQPFITRRHPSGIGPGRPIVLVPFGAAPAPASVLARLGWRPPSHGPKSCTPSFGMGTIVLSLLLSILLSTIEFLFMLSLIPTVLVLFFCGNEDVAIWKMGRWSRVCGHLLW